MTQRTFLDYDGLQRFLNNLKTIIPTKTSDITNDSGFLTQHNPVDSALSETSENAVQNKVIKGALDGKSDSGHTHTASEVSGLSTVATSGSYNDLSNTPTIPTVNNKTLTIQKNGTTVNTFTANSASDVTANITVPTAVSELTNDSGYLTSASSLDSSKLTGTIDIARLPKGALERLVTVANQTARFALTTSDVQLGDTVKQLDTGVMYIVTDETKLSSADGYTEYTAGSATSVPWSGVTGKPSSFTPSSHTHGNVTNDGKLPTASRALISDSSKNITVSSVTDTELGYLSGVTSSVQTQLNGKAASNHVHGNITNDGKVGTTANLPLITGTGGVVQAGSFGNTANTFCEGNDSRLSDARTPVAHTHVTADVTDLLNTAHAWSKAQTYSDGNAIIIKNNGVEIGNEPSSYNEQRVIFNDKNGYGIAAIKYQTQLSSNNAFANGFEFSASDKFKDGVRDPTGTTTTTVLRIGLWNDGTKYIYNEGRWRSNLLPFGNNTNDVGSSSYQWNNLYAKNFYYNGTAWGLDKANVWSANNEFKALLVLGNNGEIWFKNSQIDDFTTNPAEYGGKSVLQLWNKDNTQYSGGLVDYQMTDGSHIFEIACFGYPLNDSTPYQHRFRFAAYRDGGSDFYPTYTNSVNLGISPNQWKSVYARTYYYNGTQWGLDQANTWTAQNSFNSDLNLNYASTDVDDIVNSVAGSATLDNFVHMTGNETINGIKSFPDGVIANVTGSATSATNDGSGNVISSTYGKLGAWNEWTGNNKFISPNTIFGFKSTTAEVGSTTNSSNWMYWQDKNDFQDAYISRDIWNNGADSLRIAITSKRSNGAPSTSGTDVECGVRLDLYADGERHFNPFGDGVTNLGGDGYRWKNVYSVGVLGDVFETYPGSTGLVLRSTDQTWENGSRIFLYSNTHTGQTNGSVYIDVDHGDGNNTKSGVILLPGVFYPVGGGTNGVKLGNSTFKWKSFNGVNPGALSLATTDTTKINYFNGDITDKTGGANNKTFAVDGWITVIIPNVSGDFIAIDNSIGQTVSISGTGVGHSSIDISCPVRAGVQVTILCKCSGGSVLAAHTWCEGNV